MRNEVGQALRLYRLSYVRVEVVREGPPRCAGNMPAPTEWDCLSSPEPRQEKSQSPSLMPAQTKDTEQPTRDRRWFRNSSQLDVVDDSLEIIAA